MNVSVSVSVSVSVKTNETDSDGMLRDSSESEGGVEDGDDSQRHNLSHMIFVFSHVPSTWKRSVVTHPPHPQHSVFKPMAGLGFGLKVRVRVKVRGRVRVPQSDLFKTNNQWYTHRRAIFGFGFRQGAARALLETKHIKY